MRNWSNERIFTSHKTQCLSLLLLRLFYSWVFAFFFIPLFWLLFVCMKMKLKFEYVIFKLCEQVNWSAEESWIWDVDVDAADERNTHVGKVHMEKSTQGLEWVVRWKQMLHKLDALFSPGLPVSFSLFRRSYYLVHSLDEKFIENSQEQNK